MKSDISWFKVPTTILDLLKEEKINYHDVIIFVYILYRLTGYKDNKKGDWESKQTIELTIRKLSYVLGFSERTIIASRNKLVELGLIKIIDYNNYKVSIDLDNCQFFRFYNTMMVFDYKKLSPKEFLVLIFLCRKTIGFNKQKDTISYSQFENCLNITKSTVKKAIKKIEELALFTKEGFCKNGLIIKIEIEKIKQTSFDNRNSHNLSLIPSID